MKVGEWIPRRKAFCMRLSRPEGLVQVVHIWRSWVILVPFTVRVASERWGGRGVSVDVVVSFRDREVTGMGLVER
jgi:hypothetical protein